MGTASELLSRNVILSVSAEGFAVRVNGAEEWRPWQSIAMVSVTITTNGMASIFVIAVVFVDEKTFLVAETETIWTQLVMLLDVCLPGIEPYAVWAPKLLAEPQVVTLFGPEE